MDRDHVPAWLIVLLGLFAIAAFTTLFTFLYHYSDSESVKARKTVADETIRELRLEVGEREALLPKKGQHIALLLERDAQMDRDDQDDLEIVQSRLAPEHDRNVSEIKKLGEAKIARLERLIKSSVDVRRELVTAQEQKMEAAVAGEDELRRHRDKNEQLKLVIKNERKDQREVELDLEKQLKELQDRIQELVDRRETRVSDLLSDGILLEARAEQGFVIINRGLFDDIRVAQRFVVFNRRGGQNRIKGEIEVIEVEPNMATCRVIEEVDRNDPLIPGDHIHNNLYNPDETKIYVLAGDFEHYTKDELARFIREAGGVVDPEITTKTHYLVAGRTNNAAELAKASLNGVTILSENQLLESIRRVERYRIRRGMTFALAGTFTLVDRDRVVRYLQANGGIITNDISDGLHVLIAGENCPEELSAANLVGATVINENQLVYLMGAYADRGER